MVVVYIVVRIVSTGVQSRSREETGKQCGHPDVNLYISKKRNIIHSAERSTFNRQKLHVDLDFEVAK